MKNFTKLRLLTLLSVFCLCMGNAWGGSKTATLNFTSKCSGSGTDSEKHTWTITSDAAESNFDDNRGIHYGTGSKAVSYLTLTSSAFSGTISKIVVYAADGSKAAKIDVTVGGVTFGDQSETLTSSNTAYTFEPTTAQSSTSFTGVVVVNISKSSAKSALYCKSIEVTYTTEENQAAAPTLTAGGTFSTTPYDVTITNNEEGATVFYTTDGTTPDGTSSSFTGASKTLSISATTTVKARAYIASKDSSDVVSATYTYEPPIANTQATAYTVAQAKEIIDGGSSQLKSTRVYVTGYVSEVTSYNSTYGSLTYYISDTNGTSKDFQIYGGLNTDSTKFAGLTDLVVGDSVTVYGLIKKYNTTYEMDKNNILKFRKTSSTKTTPTITAEYKTKMSTTDPDDVYTVTTETDGAMNVTSSVTTVALAEYNSSTRQVTINPIGVGTTTIKISFDETDTYYAAEKSYTLTVTEPFDPSKANALVAEYKGKYYAAQNTSVENKYFEVTQVAVVNNKVINMEDAESHAWYITYIPETDSATVQTTSNDYLVITTSSTASLSSKENKLIVKDGGFYRSSDSDSRAFAYNYNSGKDRMASYKPSATYPIAKAMTFSDGYTRLVTKGNWGTICLPNEINIADMAGAKFYSITGKKTKTDGETPESIILTEETGNLVAGRPYFFKATADTLVVAYSSNSTELSGDYNGLFGSLSGTAGVNIGYYILSNNQLLKVDTDNFICGANRAYVVFSSINDVPSVKASIEIPIAGATGIESIDSSAIDTPSSTYSISGQKVDGNYKGIVIKNGKKYINR